MAEMSFTVSAFYKFVVISDGAELRLRLLERCRELGIKGTVLIAPEGINATISGRQPDIDGILAWLRSDPRFAGLETKESSYAAHPFQRLKVKLKSEIISMREPAANPAIRTGTYVSPEDWNVLIRDAGVTLIDTRNAYEFGIGTFEGAIDPGIGTFSDFPAYVEQNLDPARHPKVAMFCTGGIRCEKASAYLLSKGFREVYHLQGGILKYLETVGESDSLWRGECFVFDERVALATGLSAGTHSLCPRCGAPIPANKAASSEQPATTSCAECKVVNRTKARTATSSRPGRDGRRRRRE